MSFEFEMKLFVLVAEVEDNFKINFLIQHVGPEKWN